MSTSSLTPAAAVMQSMIQQYFAASRGNNKAEEMAACFTADSISYDPAEGPGLEGKAALQQFFATIVDLFETIGLQEEFVSINGNQAAVKWTGHGVGKNGIEVTFEGIDLFEFNLDGKIQSMRAYWDSAAMLTKLGVL